MQPLRALGLAVTAALGVSGSALADEAVRPTSTPPTTVAAKLFGPSKPKSGPAAKTSNASPGAAVIAPLSTEIIAAALHAEQDAWERRMSVCLKLRQVAMDSNDEALMRQVDDLEREATALYHARTKSLGVSKYLPAADQSGDIRVAAKKLTTPTRTTGRDTAVRTAEARTPNDVIREVRP